MSQTIKQAQKSLQWSDGVGFLSINKCPTKSPYNRSYFQEMEKLYGTWQGRALTKMRVKMIQKSVSYRKEPSYCLDVGCGTGHFIKEVNRLTDIKAEGIDINELSIQWLHQHDVRVSRMRYNILTFWNSFQDIENPMSIVEEYQPQFVAMSLPVFRDKEHAIRSHYFKPKEVHWYFTRRGLLNMMEQRGYNVVFMNTEEDRKVGCTGVVSIVFTTKAGF